MIRPRTAAAATLLAFGAALAGVFAGATPAAAHVTVNPTEATQGGYTRAAFRVPTESDTAATTKVEVFLPVDAPVASVSTMPVPGWTAVAAKGKPAKPVEAHGEEITEVITKITWTATKGAEIKPGQFQEFPVSLGPLPKVDRVVFKAIQYYSDGNVVRWIEEPMDGGEEPEHPAPVMKLAAEQAVQPSAAAAPPTTGDDSDGDGPALPLAVAGLVVGLAGAVLGGLAFWRTRRTG